MGGGDRPHPADERHSSSAGRSIPPDDRGGERTGRIGGAKCGRQRDRLPFGPGDRQNRVDDRTWSRRTGGEGEIIEGGTPTIGIGDAIRNPPTRQIGSFEVFHPAIGVRCGRAEPDVRVLGQPARRVGGKQVRSRAVLDKVEGHECAGREVDPVLSSGLVTAGENHPTVRFGQNRGGIAG